MYAASSGGSAARLRCTSTRDAASIAVAAPGGRNRSAGADFTRRAPCQVSRKFGNRRIFKNEVRTELDCEPFFELDDQIQRVCRVEYQPGEFGIRVDHLLRQVERPCEVLDAA